MSVDIILKDIEWDGVNKIRVPLEGGGTQDFSIGGGTPTLQTKTKTYAPTESQQTETVSADAGYDGLDEVGITVGAISPTYVGSGITQRTSSNLTVSGATVTAPAGYYSSSASKSVATGSAGTPTASKGTVSNHAISVTPKVTNSTGYITGGTINGLAVSVSASELVSGTKSITQNGTGIDVTNYASVSVNVSTPTPTLQTKSKTYTPTTSQQTETIQADSGYDGLDEVNITVNAMPSGTEGTPTATKGTVSNHSVSVTPSVTNSAGYISGGTKTGNAITVTATELASGNLPITQNADNINVVGYASVSVNVPTNLQTKTRTFTPTFSQQVEVIGPDSGYDGLNAVGITVEAVQMMSLPRVASLTSTGSRRARIYQSNATQYWNIPEGYHTEAEYYEVAPLNVAPKIITANGNYNAGDEDLDGYSSVSVSVPTGGATLQTKSATYTPNSSTQTDTITPDSGYDGLDKVNITINPVDPKLVTGTFTTGSTAGYTNINIPYTHSGYPIMCVVVVDGGAYKSGTDWYNSSQRYAIGQWTMTKANMSSVPTYTTSGTQNQGVTTWVYKNTSSTSYSRSSAMSTNVYSSSNASNSGANTIKFKSGNVLSYYVNTSSYGLHPNITYRYFIVYS